MRVVRSRRRTADLTCDAVVCNLLRFARIAWPGKPGGGAGSDAATNGATANGAADPE